MGRGKRMEDLKCKSFTPLTEEELTHLNPIGLKQGNTEVDRFLLAKLLSERDRLQCVLEAAKWLIEELIQAGMIEREHKQLLEPDELERAIYVLRNSVTSWKK
tara:strand:+ start:1562 stop:1870 length:309 start_codon:yes stop_codon:yes gene_type:complete